MLSLLIRSRTLRSLLELFCSQPDRRFYTREIERLTGEPMGALQRQLVRLEEGGLLVSERVGPLKYFSLNKDFPYRGELQTMMTRELRRQKLSKNLAKLLKTLKQKYHPDKIILFGSMAKGSIHPHSDIDLFIIKQDVPSRYSDRLRELAPLLVDCKVGVDCAVWTPIEFEQEQKTNLFLREEILKKGKVLYEQAA